MTKSKARRATVFYQTLLSIISTIPTNNVHTTHKNTNTLRTRSAATTCIHADTSTDPESSFSKDSGSVPVPAWVPVFAALRVRKVATLRRCAARLYVGLVFFYLGINSYAFN